MSILEDLSGRIIKSYELKELIGVGGFGAVYRAHQQFIGREVAIKVILPQHANRPDFIRRFETEAQLVARLEHPHIVPLYDYWREPSGAYLVMRWLRGGSAQEYVEKNGPWDLAAVRILLNHIAEALAVAHRQGVVHRDLKPENIMLDENGNAYLTDFGIAKDLAGSKVTQNNAIVGSPAYLSPEQIQGQEVTPRSDIYTLGVVLYELLTGERPFTDNNPATLMFKHLSDPLPDMIRIKPDLPPQLDHVIQRATAKDPEHRYEDTIALARDFRRATKLLAANDDRDEELGSATAVITSSSIVLPAPENPYKGLRAFQQADAQDFFGRDELVDNIIARMREDTNDFRFLAVVGPSGSGKSSVVKAGVIPALREGAIYGAQDWYIVEMVPGLDPMEELEAALLRIAVNPPDSLLTQLNEDERGLLRAVKRVLPTDDAELLLVIDQFEELFTLVEEEDETIRAHFLTSLVEAVKDPRSPIRVIITLRADFYDRPLQYNNFGNLMRQRTEVVLPLSSEELERAVSGPAERVRIHIEPPLLSAIVADVNEQPGALPLLQYALTELFERRDGHVLTLEAYQHIGGTMGALARRAEELYASIGDEGQEATRQMFLRLVTLGEGAEDTRRRVLQSELFSIGDDQDTMTMVIEAFGRYRLLTFDHDQASRTATVEVAHEALIRQWQRLREWLADNRDDLRAQRRINAAAIDWVGAKRDASFLARGSRLAQFETWQANTNLALNQLEQEYLQASIGQREKALAEEKARQEREEALEQRSRSRLRALLGVMSVAAIVAALLAGIAFTQRQQAQDARKDAENSAEIALNAQADAERNADEAQGLALAANARNALIQSDTSLALTLAMAASEAFSPAPVEVRRVLATTAYGPGARYRFIADQASVVGTDFSHDGSFAASVSLDGFVHLWDLTTGESYLEFNLGEDIYATDIAFSPDDTQFAIAIDNEIAIYDATSGDLIRTLIGHTEIITKLAYAEEVPLLVSGGLDRQLILWDTDSGEIRQQFPEHAGVIIDVSISNDGLLVASSTGDTTSADTLEDEEDRKVRLFDAQTGTLLQTFDPQNGYVRAVAISPDKSLIISAAWDSATRGIIDVWDVRTGQPVRRLFGHINLITDIAFSADGSTIFSISTDQTMRLWNTDNGLEIAMLEVFNDRPLTLALSKNGELAAVGTGNYGDNLIDTIVERSTTPSLWVIDLQNRAEIRNFVAEDEWAWSVDVSPDGTLAASGYGPLRPPAEGMDTSVHIWDIASGRELRRLIGHFSTVEGVAFSPDGEHVLSGAWDGQLILWDITNGNEIMRFADPDAENTPVEIIRDGSRLALDLGERAMNGRILNVAFSPDGSIVAASNSTGQVTLWDANSGEKLRTFGDHTDAVAGLDFSPDGTFILTGSWDMTAKLWEVATGELVQTFEGHSNLINDAIFHPDSNRILTASWDSTIRLWDIASGREIRRYTGHNGQIQTIAFNNTGDLILSGAADTTVRLWETETAQEVFVFENHTDWVSEVHFITGTNFAISSAQDYTLKLWQVPLDSQQIINWATENRYIRPLTAAECEQYRIETACEA